MTTFNNADFASMIKEALPASGRYIRDAILGNINLSDYLIKGDNTAVTAVDKKSQDIALPIIKKYFPNARINQEESKVDSGNLDADIIIYHDPLDGTKGFLIGGPTPTVIIAAYDKKNKEFLATATMEPATGRIWQSYKNDGATLSLYSYALRQHQESSYQSIRVNNAPLKNGTVLVDVGHAFARTTPTGVKQILTQDNRRDLSNNIESLDAKEYSFQTNGGHYALVSTGRPSLVGCITTAIGGPYDIAGMLHVKEAGGAIRSFTITNRILSALENPMDIANTDIVIAANTEENLEKLTSAVRKSFNDVQLF